MIKLYSKVKPPFFGSSKVQPERSMGFAITPDAMRKNSNSSAKGNAKAKGVPPIQKKQPTTEKKTYNEMYDYTFPLLESSAISMS